MISVRSSTDTGPGRRSHEQMARIESLEHRARTNDTDRNSRRRVANGALLMKGC